MFAARKRVFVDLLRWKVPVVAGRFELDQFDGPGATYLVLASEGGGHVGSARLLPTTRPHLLGDLFPALCDDPPPRGPDVREITRFCLDRSLDAAGRLSARDTLVTALATYAAQHAITRYTAVAEPGWVDRIASFGWATHRLGPVRRVDGEALCAVAIDITVDTSALLRAAGVHPDARLLASPRRAA
jgi:N-acyl-L-homoserine lactone synthetase